ncbi:MAG: type II secretion system minor pseudopilin GspK [Gammaproteobacteria bacterium (ex Lamellibrachia satsuma)]|nr:MAG: type II secretion system minor pseudopilin GspK [Gammaproteobacteria bacterium (ex Lamellibrachia satsuma)]
MQNRSPRIRSQSGVALITAIMIVAVASIAAVTMTETLQLSIRRTSNILITDQTYFYALGSEEWARGQLIRDARSDKQASNPYDALDEDWAKPLPITAVEGGTVAAQIVDLQARFNLNNLYLAEEPDQESKDRTAQHLVVFSRLLNLLELEEGLAQTVSDWLDQDIDAQFPDGAEDNEYLGGTLPYRTANGLMSSPTELLLIKNITPEIFERLEPHVTTLPETVPININTADAILLRALVESLTDSDAETLTSERKESPFTNKKAFEDRLTELLSDNKELLNNADKTYSVSSNYFLLETSISMDNTNQYLRCLINKTDKGVYTLSRTTGTF